MTIIDANISRPLEGGASFSLGNRAYRALWRLTWLLLCRWTPPPAHAWRRIILRLFGAIIESGARIYASSVIWSPRNLKMARFSCLGPGTICYNQALIQIGARAVVSQGAHLCAGSHDVSDPNFQLITRPIFIEKDAWIAAEAFVGPGVTISNGAVLAARGVTFTDLEAWKVYRGNPAVLFKARTFHQDSEKFE